MRGRPLKILYYVGFGPYWGRYDPSQLDAPGSPMLGGGETAALRTALALASIGHSVSYCGHCATTTHAGVSFFDKTDYCKLLLEQPWDAVVSWSDVKALRVVPAGVVRLLAQQLNDLAFPEDWWQCVDGIVSPSITHASYLSDNWVPAGITVPFYLVYNGVDIEPFGVPKALADRKPWVGYWSSPDRGLHHVLRAWPLVEQAYPGAQLHVFYEIDRWVALAREHTAATLFVANYVDELRRRSLCENWNVIYHGAVGRATLREHQRDTVALAYPCDPVGFTEGFGCAVVEALAAGCVPILRSADAFPELYDGVSRWLRGPPGSESFATGLASTIVDVLKNRQAPTREMRERALSFSWDAAGTQMERAIRAARRGEGGLFEHREV